MAGGVVGSPQHVASSMTDEELIAQWHSLNSAKEAAEALSVDYKVVLREWRRLKASWKLPSGDRPRKNSAKYRPNHEGNQDGRPSVGDDELARRLSEGKR
jgi:hypothetical protein